MVWRQGSSADEAPAEISVNIVQRCLSLSQTLSKWLFPRGPMVNVTR